MDSSGKNPALCWLWLKWMSGLRRILDEGRYIKTLTVSTISKSVDVFDVKLSLGQTTMGCALKLDGYFVFLEL